MANSFAVNSTPLGLNYMRVPGLVSLTITIGSVYATATGGLTLDLTAPLQSIDQSDFPSMTSGQQGGTNQTGVAFARVVDVLFGQVITAGTNMSIGQVLVFSRVAGTPYGFTARNYSTLTGTEQAEGAAVGVVKCWVLIA